MCLFNRRCRLNVFEHKLQQNFDPFLCVSTCSGGADTDVDGAEVERMFLSGSGARARAAGGGGNASWLARGFLIPWPPLTNSNGKSFGKPSYKQKKKVLRLTHNNR